MAKVAVLMGSKSDFPVVKPAVKVLKDFGVEAEVRVISAHRTPDEAHEFASGAKGRGVEVIICAAGKAAQQHPAAGPACQDIAGACRSRRSSQTSQRTHQRQRQRCIGQQQGKQCQQRSTQRDPGSKRKRAGFDSPRSGGARRSFSRIRSTLFCNCTVRFRLHFIRHIKRPLAQ